MTKKVWISNILNPGCVVARNLTDSEKVFVFSGDKRTILEVVNIEGCDKDRIYISRKDAEELGLRGDGETVTINSVIQDPIEKKSRFVGFHND